MVCPPYQEGPGHTFAIHPSYLVDACFLIFLVMLFAEWHASDFVPTLYELKL